MKKIFAVMMCIAMIGALSFGVTGCGDKPAPKKDGGAAKDTPAKATPAKDTPAKDTPAKDTPAKDTPAKDTPAKDAPKKDAK